MKTWKCSQCGNTIDRGFVASLGGAPTECPVCGNDEFEDPVTVGAVHSALDRVLS